MVGKGLGGSWGPESGAKDAAELGARLGTHLGMQNWSRERRQGGWQEGWWLQAPFIPVNN